MAAQKVICDSDVIIELTDRTGNRHEQAASVVGEIGIDNICMSAVTWMEVVKGIRDREHEQQVLKKMRGIVLAHLTQEVSLRAMGLLLDYHLSHGLGIADALVAATAIETGLPLLTYNTRDFRFIEGLRLYAP